MIVTTVRQKIKIAISFNIFREYSDHSSQPLEQPPRDFHFKTSKLYQIMHNKTVDKIGDNIHITSLKICFNFDQLKLSETYLAQLNITIDEFSTFFLSSSRRIRFRRFSFSAFSEVSRSKFDSSLLVVFSIKSSLTFFSSSSC